MYGKIFTLVALAAAVVAVPSESGNTNACNVGSMQCCNSVQSANSSAVQKIVQGNSLVGAALALAPVTIPVGVTCSPITAVGGAGNSCNAQPVCCSNNNFNGVVAIGCTPINVNL